MKTKISSTNFLLMNKEFVKLDCFNSQNYIRLVVKVNFFVAEALLCFRSWISPIPTVLIPEAGKEPDMNVIFELEKPRALCKEYENLWLGHIINSLSNRLYDLYMSVIGAKELSKTLELKYKGRE